MFFTLGVCRQLVGNRKVAMLVRSLHQTMQQEQTGDIGENRLHLVLDFKLYLSGEDAKLLQKDMEELFTKYASAVSGKKPHSVWLSINRDENS